MAKVFTGKGSKNKQQPLNISLPFFGSQCKGHLLNNMILSSNVFVHFQTTGKGEYPEVQRGVLQGRMCEGSDLSKDKTTKLIAEPRNLSDNCFVT